MHITKSTLEYLGDKFEVEPGGGASREAYLADHKVESYLIIPPKVSNIHLYIPHYLPVYKLLFIVRLKNNKIYFKTLFYFLF